FLRGHGTCHVFIDAPEMNGGTTTRTHTIDGRPWLRRGFTRTLRCEDCGIDYPVPEPRLFSFNSPLCACPECDGVGNIIDIDVDMVVLDQNKTVAEGAIAPWNTPAYAHELEELLAHAKEVQLPVNVPFKDLAPEHLEIIREGSPQH